MFENVSIYLKNNKSKIRELPQISIAYGKRFCHLIGLPTDPKNLAVRIGKTALAFIGISYICTTSMGIAIASISLISMEVIYQNNLLDKRRLYLIRQPILEGLSIHLMRNIPKDFILMLAKTLKVILPIFPSSILLYSANHMQIEESNALLGANRTEEQNENNVISEDEISDAESLYPQNSSSLFEISDFTNLQSHNSSAAPKSPIIYPQFSRFPLPPSQLSPEIKQEQPRLSILLQSPPKRKNPISYLMQSESLSLEEDIPEEMGSVQTFFPKTFISRENSTLFQYPCRNKFHTTNLLQKENRNLKEDTQSICIAPFSSKTTALSLKAELSNPIVTEQYLHKNKQKKNRYMTARSIEDAPIFPFPKDLLKQDKSTQFTPLSSDLIKISASPLSTHRRSDSEIETNASTEQYLLSLSKEGFGKKHLDTAPSNFEKRRPMPIHIEEAGTSSEDTNQRSSIIEEHSPSLQKLSRSKETFQNKRFIAKPFQFSKKLPSSHFMEEIDFDSDGTNPRIPIEEEQSPSQSSKSQIKPGESMFSKFAI